MASKGRLSFVSDEKLPPLDHELVLTPEVRENDALMNLIAKIEESSWRARLGVRIFQLPMDKRLAIQATMKGSFTEIGRMPVKEVKRWIGIVEKLSNE